MRKISLWTIGMIMVAGVTSMGALGQTPTQPEVQTQTPTQTPSTERQVSHRKRGADRLARIDANRDGKISREEWPRKAEVFARLDNNNDGFLTADEVRGGKHDKGSRARKAFGSMDQNSDGQITREEWKGRAEVFDRLDANSDGVVNAEELKGARPRGKRDLR